LWLLSTPEKQGSKKAGTANTQGIYQTLVFSWPGPFGFCLTLPKEKQCPPSGPDKLAGNF